MDCFGLGLSAHLSAAPAWASCGKTAGIAVAVVNTLPCCGIWGMFLFLLLLEAAPHCAPGPQSLTWVWWEFLWSWGTEQGHREQEQGLMRVAQGTGAGAHEGVTGVLWHVWRSGRGGHIRQNHLGSVEAATLPLSGPYHTALPHCSSGICELLSYSSCITQSINKVHDENIDFIDKNLHIFLAMSVSFLLATGGAQGHDALHMGPAQWHAQGLVGEETESYCEKMGEKVVLHPCQYCCAGSTGEMGL